MLLMQRSNRSEDAGAHVIVVAAYVDRQDVATCGGIPRDHPKARILAVQLVVENRMDTGQRAGQVGRRQEVEGPCPLMAKDVQKHRGCCGRGVLVRESSVEHIADPVLLHGCAGCERELHAPQQGQSGGEQCVQRVRTGV